MSETNLKPTLHLIQKSLSASEFARQINRMTTDGDQLLFIGDCVFDCAILNPLINQLDNLTVYVIDSDITARALNESLTEQVKLIDFEKFVSLTINAKKVISW